MTPPAPTSSEAARLKSLCRLRELVVALDRRAPQAQRAGEAAIARSGSELHAAALRRIAELERAAPAATKLTKTR